MGADSKAARLLERALIQEAVDFRRVLELLHFTHLEQEKIFQFLRIILLLLFDEVHKV